jgi:AcrR family transcriptional regulator
MANKRKIEPDLSTEQKIKEAARKVFTQKGYSATRTRDIAEEAGINLALLNYYFRSKEKLFEQVMMERMQQLFGTLVPIIIDSGTDLETKIERIVSQYIDMLTEHPDLPIFVLSEIRKSPGLFANKLPIAQFIQHSSLILQIKEKRPDLNPFHFLMNILGMTVFPFVASPVFESIPMVQSIGFNNLIQERKILIPKWIKAMMDQGH